MNASSRFRQILAKEPNYPTKGIDLRQSGEVMALAGVDLDFMRNAVLLEKPLQPSGLFDRDNGILLAMQNQHRRKLSSISSKRFGEPAEKFRHCDDPRIACGQSQRKVCSQGEPEKSYSPLIDSRLLDHIADGVAEGFQPVQEVGLDLAGRHASVASALEVPNDKNMHSEPGRLLGKWIDPAQRPSGAVQDNDGGPRSRPGRIVINPDLFSAAEK